MKSIAISVLALALSAAGTGAEGQLMQKQALTLEGAKQVMAAAEAEARRQSFPCSIKNGRSAMVALNDFTPLQGGLPITVNGRVVGAIGVSGNKPPKDEEIAQAGANALGGAPAIVPTGAGATGASSAGAASMSAPAPDPVSYFDKEQVEAAFEKGAVLFDGAGRNYMVHTSRREKAGMAEVHALDTDVIYVMKGGATFVTGGTVVEGATTAPNEIRGSSIEGGETRQISEGDVIIVPHGVPHWFKEVRAPLLYYVVKVS